MPPKCKMTFGVHFFIIGNRRSKMDYINLKKRKDIIKLGFKDEDGNILTNKDDEEIFLEFDLGDIELPIKYNRCVNSVNQAKKNLKIQFVIIDKKQDHKGKQLLSSKEEAKAKAIRQFYKEMQEAMDLFLGEGGTEKFLNGKKPYWEMWEDIDEALAPYYDQMKLTVNSMTERIKEKYKISESEGKILKND